MGQVYHGRKVAVFPDMPVASLAQTLADRYHLDVAEVDLILRADNDCGKGWEGQKRHCVRSKVAHGAEHLTESAAGWAVGKFVGGAIAQVAASHGFPPAAAHLISETAVQAIAATFIHARKPENRNPTELAAKFLTEAAAAAIGKSSHSGAHTALEHIEGSAHAKALGSIIAGKAGGISTAVAVSDLAHRTAERLTKQSKALHALVTARVPVSRTDATSGATDQLTPQERSALFDLTMAGWAIAHHLKPQPKQDAMPTATTPLDDRLTLAKLIGEELQSPGLYGAPIRIRKFNVQGRTVTGEFVGTEDGRSYSFTYTNGKVTYQPAVGTLDSGESVSQYAARWDSYTEALEVKVSNPVRLDAAGKRLKCGTSAYQCGGTCLGVHKNCHKNEKAAIDHDRLNKINALIDHLSQGGEHPSKALDKPGVGKLQGVATQIQQTRDLKAANPIAKRTGDRMAKPKTQPEEHIGKQIEHAVSEENAARQKYYQTKAPEDLDAKNAAYFRTAALKEKSGVKSSHLLDLDQKANALASKMLSGAGDEKTKQALNKVRAEKEFVQHFLYGTKAPDSLIDEHPELAAKYGKTRSQPKPASMTVGSIVPGTDKPPKIIPQTKADPPEVLPPEAPRKMRSRAEKESDISKMQANLEDAARGIAHTAILQHAAYQTAMGAEISPEATRQAQKVAGDLAVAKLRAGKQQPALSGVVQKRRLGKGGTAEAAQQSVKETALSTGKAAVAHEKFMGTAMQMAQEVDRRSSQSINPEVLPPEAPRSPRAKRLANLVGQLQTNHEADIKNAAQIHAVANTALQQLDPTYTPQLPTQTASTFQKPKGTPKQRIEKLLGDLQTNHEADIKNAAATYAVAQTAVNELARREGQATGAKAIAGTEKGAGTKAVKPTDVDKDGVLVRTFPSDLQKNKSFGSDYVSEQRQKGQRANIFGQQRRVETAEPHMFTKDDYVKAWKDVKGDQRRFLESKGKYVDVLENKHKGAVQAALKAGKAVPDEVTKDYPDLVAKYRKPKKPIESAPPAPQSRSRTAGEVTPQYPHNRHVSIDSLTDAIAKYQQQGIHIDSDTALAILKRADNCGCDECQHKDQEMSEYDRLVKSLAAKGAKDPKALAAAIGRRKLGKKEFLRRAAAGAREAAKA